MAAIKLALNTNAAWKQTHTKYPNSEPATAEVITEEEGSRDSRLDIHLITHTYLQAVPPAGLLRTRLLIYDRKKEISAESLSSFSSSKRTGRLQIFSPGVICGAEKQVSEHTARYTHAGDGYVSQNWRRTAVSHCGGSGSLPTCCSLAWLRFRPPFMSPNNQQQPCCLDQWFANFHTRHKQRLNMGAVQQFVESVSFSLFFSSLRPP